MTLRDVITVIAWRKRETREDASTTSLTTRPAVVVPIHIDQGEGAISRRGRTTPVASEKVPTEDASLEQEHLKK